MIQLALLAIQAGGTTMDILAKRRQARAEKKYIKQQIMEIEQQKNFATQMSLRTQGESILEEEITIGRSIAGTAKAGLRTSSGSSQSRREAIREMYGRDRETVRLQTSENLRQMAFQQYMLSKKGKPIGRASRLDTLTSILSGAASMGQKAYKAGMFKDLFGNQASNAATGGGAYGGTMGGGPTGGGSRSMIG